MAGTGMAWSRMWKRGTALLAFGALSAMPLASGCGAFFQCEGKSDCPATSGGTDNGDVVFAANEQSTGIYAFYLSGSQMYAVAGEPFSTSFAVQSMVTARTNGYLFVASAVGIYSYVVSSAGVLSSGTEQVVTSYPQVSMDVSPDGKWLVAVDSSLSTAPAVKVYQISSGTLTLESETVLASVGGRTLSPQMVRFSPDNNYIGVAMSGNGVLVVPFVDSTGAQSTTTSFYVAPNTASSGDNAIAWDASDNLYIGRSTANTGSTGDTGVWMAPVADFTSGSGLYLSVSASLLATTDSAPRALAFADSYGLLYTANTAASTINGFTVSTSSGSVKLTSLGTSTAAPTSVEALGVDSSGNYLFAGGTSGSAGLQLYSIASGGALTQENSAPTGTTSGIPALAVTY